jgi:hypothetical protein
VRVLICGSRDWTDSFAISSQLALIYGQDPERVAIHGNNGDMRARPPRGADVLAGWCAVGVGARVEVFAVDHAKDGEWPSAGPRRNSRMLTEGKPDKGLAFGPIWELDFKEDRALGVVGGRYKRTGTGDMVKKMLAAGIPVRWIVKPDAPAVDLTEMPGPPCS